MKTFTILILTITLVNCSLKRSSKEATQKEISIVMNSFNAQDYSKTISITDSLLEIYPEDARLYLIKGRAYSSQDNLSVGLDNLNKAITLNSNYHEAYGYRAVVRNLLNDKDIDGTLKDYEIAIAHDDRNIELLKSKANLLWKNKRFDESLKVCDFILNIDSINYSTLILQTNIYKESKKYDLALKNYEKAIQLAPSNSFAFEERAFLFLSLNEFEKAINDFTVAIKLDEKSYDNIMLRAFAFNNRGYALYKNGEFNKALKDINHSLALFEENSYAYRNRALVNLAIDNLIDACNDLNKALDLGYSDKYGDDVMTLIDENCK